MGIFTTSKKVQPLKIEVFRESYIINESTNTKNKSERKVKCPFCNLKDTKENIVHHVAEEHEDMIPQDYTAARVVFNYLNKKEFGRCIECRRETKWNEENWRYERLCERKTCYDSYVAKVKGRMVKKYGKEHLLDDMEQQKKMLDNRSISGSYKFRDGGIRTYVGTYEKKLLEFYDKVLNVPSTDILTPGPNIEYEFNGKKHVWITDLYYIPLNLVHDVKDGGDNPNNRDMGDYRAKQIAKETAITELNKFNYIRLTNNNFEQLLFIIAEIKSQLMDSESNEYTVHINEMSAIGGVMAPANANDGYVIPCMINNGFIGYAFSTDKYLDNTFMVKDNKIKKITPEEMKDYKITLYKYNREDAIEKIDSIINDYKTQSVIENTDNYFYNKFTGRDLLSIDQLSFDENFEEVIDGFTESIEKQNIIEESLKYKYDRLRGFIDYSIPVIGVKENNIKESIIKNFKNIDVLQDYNGYHVKNIYTESRSRNYDNITDIPKYILELVNEN